jgi:hypothetical protein
MLKNTLNGTNSYGGEEVMLLKIDSKDLNEQRLSLPSDLAGEFTLLVLGYDESQQQLCDTWLSFAERLEEAFPAFRYQWMPIVEPRNSADKSSGDRDTRNGKPKLANDARELHPQDDGRRAIQQFGLQDEQDISMVLVRQDGEVLWCVQGVWTPAKAESLDETLLALIPLADDPDDCLFEDSEIGEVFEHTAAWSALPVFV